jgi:hypothetical protein
MERFTITESYVPISCNEGIAFVAKLTAKSSFTFTRSAALSA